MVLLIVVLPSTGFSAQNVRVEMMVFRHDQIEALSGEIFPNRVYQPTFAHAHEVTDEDGLDAQRYQQQHRQRQHRRQGEHTTGWYHALGDNHWSKSFKRINKLLKNNEQYYPLMRLSWRQPINSTGQTAHIQSGVVYNSNGQSMAQPYESALNDNLYHSVDGAMTIKKRHVIDVELAMVVTQPVANLAKPLQSHLKGHNQMVSLPLHQKRQMHYNELNYFDHPVYGVLIKVIPEKD
jgi:hypothetical protein